MSQLIEDLKHVNKALRRFNNMYEMISTKKLNTPQEIEQLKIIQKYGINLLNMYKGCNFIDIESKVRALKSRLEFPII